MNKHSPLLCASLLLGCAGSNGSTDKGTVSLEEFNYEDVELPDHFSDSATGGMGGLSVVDMDNTPEDNPITNAGAGLGRVLFYDENLSTNGTIACGTCHKAELGFSDDLRLSVGFDGGETDRHSMGLTNARFYAPGMFFWDQRADTLEEQVLMPFLDEVEMGMTLETLVAAVEGQEFYAELFEGAFGDSEVTSERISLALAQFVRSLVSYGSPYDEGRAQVSSAIVDFPSFTDEENLGKEIFMNTPMGPNGAGCAVCHQGETMSAAAANNNGLDADSNTDAGYGDITGSSGDMGTFKVPSLRNIAVRGGFMHDGRFATLREVVDHYADSVEAHPNLGMPLNMHDIDLTEEHREALVAFLVTLTDEGMLSDPKFANPFE
jgi:cytochrome c peroxidase